MKCQICKILVVIFILLLGIIAPIVQAQSPQQALNQYIADLQKKPSDNALSEKIIKHVQGVANRDTLRKRD